MKKIICKLKSHKFMYVKWYQSDANFPHFEYLCINCGGLTGDRRYAKENGLVMNGYPKHRDKVEDKFGIEDIYIL